MSEKKKKKKITHSQTTHIINEKTGEVLETTLTETYRVEKEPDFIKMYISDIARLNELPKGMDMILLALVRNMGYNNVIPAYKPIKKLICHDLGISLSYLNKAIDTFYKKGVFIRLDRGIYMADPELFARGSWSDIQKLRLVIEYDKDKGTKRLKSNLPEEVQMKLGLDFTDS